MTDSAQSGGQFGECPYAEAEWACCKRAGHDGPHESAPTKAPERVQLMAECYVGLEFGDYGTVVERLEGEAMVRFDRDGTERLIIRSNLGTVAR